MSDELEPISRSDGMPTRAAPALVVLVTALVVVAVAVLGVVGRGGDEPTPVADRTDLAWSVPMGDPADAADAVVTPPIEDVQRVPGGWLVTTSLDLVRVSDAGEVVWSRAWRGGAPVVLGGFLQAVDGRYLLTLGTNTGAIVERVALADPVAAPTGMVPVWTVAGPGPREERWAFASRGELRVVDAEGRTVLEGPSGGPIAGLAGPGLVIQDRGGDVVAVDPAAADADGAVVWRVDTPDRPRPDLVRVARLPGRDLVVYGHLGGVTALDAATGETAWRWRPAPGDDLDARVLGVEGAAVTVEVRPAGETGDGEVGTLDPATGTPREGRVEAPDPADALPDDLTIPAFVPPAPPAWPLPDGTVVTTTGQLVLGVREGEVRWRTDADARDASVGVSGSTVVVVGASLRALASDGTPRWEDDLGDRERLLAVGDETVVSLVPGAPPTVVATAVASGRGRGRLALPVSGTVEASTWDGRWLTLLVRGSSDLAGVLVGIELTDGGWETRWNEPAPGVTDLVGGGGVDDADGAVVAVGRSHATVVDPASGAGRDVLLDTLATPGRAAAGEGVLAWVAGREVVVTALSSGEEVARVTLPAEPSTAPTVADGLVLVPTVDGALQRIALGDDPTLLAPVSLGELPAAAPVVAAHDTIAVRTRTHVLLLRAPR